MKQRFKKDYAFVHPWQLYSENLQTERLQCKDEGKDISQLEPFIDYALTLPCGEAKEELGNFISREISKAQNLENYPFYEPSDLEGIRKQRATSNAELPAPDNDRDLHDKISGAWLGRICGCLLGKPVEGWSRGKIEAHLKENSAYPLSFYIPKGACEGGSGWVGELSDAAPADDDTNYTVMAAKLIERYGRDFTPKDMARTWLEAQPVTAYCTAERVAYMNILKGILPPHSANHKNAFREWIGAQIRGDYFGYINPGDPRTAAEMAWRDGILSHIKNGIYGEMFIAAVIAAAPCSPDIASALQAGLLEIPQNSRLSKAIQSVFDAFEEGKSVAKIIDEIHSQYDEGISHHWCHTIPNAMIVCAALLGSKGDFGRAVCGAVEAGFDTDCNGATVGSIFGMFYGARAIEQQWTEPFGDLLETSLVGLCTVKISDMVKLTMKHIWEK